MAVSFASSPRSSLRKTNTRKTSPMPSPDGGSTKISPDSRTQAQSVRPARCSLISRFRRSIPHFLLDFPPAASLAMEHQRHLPVSVEIRIPFRSLRHLMLCRPLGRPVSAHLNVVKHHLLFRHFVSRHLRQNVFNPRRDGLSAHQRCLPRHQIHAVFCPHRHDPRCVHLQMQLDELLVERINLASRASRQIPGLHAIPSGPRSRAPTTMATFLKLNIRSEEHTSELQSRLHIVCRLLLETKNSTHHEHTH